MKHIRVFVSENFHFLVVNFSVYLNRRVFVMKISSKQIQRLINQNAYLVMCARILVWDFDRR